MGRRGGDVEMGGEAWRWEERHEDALWHGGEAAPEWAVPHSHVVDKNQEEYIGSKQSQPQPDGTARVPALGR